MKKIVVIGAGAAGILAALQAAKKDDNKVILMERNDRIGRKLMITGKGRCNITNVADLPTFIKNIPGNGKFLYSAFRNFFNDDVISFFEKIGVATKVERGGRVFPQSDRAVEVVEGRTYKADAVVSSTTGVTDTWFEIYVGYAKPTPNNDYTGDGVSCRFCGHRRTFADIRPLDTSYKVTCIT